MSKDSTNRSWLKRANGGPSGNFRPYDALTLLLGAVLGFAGNSFFNGDVSTGTSLVILVVLTLCAAVNISLFRADTEAKTVAIIEELQEKLKKHLNQVYASFVRETSGTEGTLANSKHVYDAGTAAVRRAQKRIFVIGDYCPPAEEGAALDKPPEHRSEYLRAIEQMLAERLDENSYPAPALKYHRFIQRPINVYKEIKGREATGRPGIVLKPDDMIGDMQVFEYCYWKRTNSTTPAGSE